MANYLTGKHLSRRTFIRGLGASIALPYLDAMEPAGRILGLSSKQSFTRLVCIEESMGAPGSTCSRRPRSGGTLSSGRTARSRRSPTSGST